MGVVIPVRQLIGLAMERFEALAHPRVMTSPVSSGATPAEWASLAGVGSDSTPHELINGPVLDVGVHHPENIAHQALQRLTARSVTERIFGLPMRYRPVAAAPDRTRGRPGRWRGNHV